MQPDPSNWTNRCPGDLSDVLPEVRVGEVAHAVRRAENVFPEWSGLPWRSRADQLLAARDEIAARSEELALAIARETGKPLTEARGELGAVVAKFELTIEDGERYLEDQPATGGPHPALVRARALGPAAVVAPFNFPLHLGHGAAVAYLLAGNPVVFKPSPLAANVCAAYGEIMARHLPPGVFQVVQGWGATARELVLSPGIRAVCFTGSVTVGRLLARELADDVSKILALELGGKNASLVFDDADLPAAAQAVAQSLCLTTGQRCNATSRLLIERKSLHRFLPLLTAALEDYQPSFPLLDSCRLGPLISSAAVDRYRRLTSLPVGQWLLPGRVHEKVGDHCGWYVHPALVLCEEEATWSDSALGCEEIFCPVLSVHPFDSMDEAARLHNHGNHGLSTSIFSESRETFERLGPGLRAGNLYWNLPTTLSPSTLPFGGWADSGNGRPGARGFIRYALREQAVQWKAS